MNTKTRVYFTIGQAAEATGKAKSTIKKAIDTGDLSVAEKTRRGFKIDAAELFRVFPERSQKNETERSETAQNAIENSVLQARIDMQEKRIAEVEADRDRWQAAFEKQQDLAANALRQLEDQREKVTQPTKRGWWSRLTGS